MRGKVCPAPILVHAVRITLAYAGKSSLDFLRNQTAEDHPRVCGEKHLVILVDILWEGSPPRMRGKASRCFCDTSPHRITPAYAGKSGIACTALCAKRDHPRVCGEKPPLQNTAAAILGSPPRMRGKAYSPCKPFPATGITPAYAGKSMCFHPYHLVRRDHPRVCGEKKLVGSPTGWHLGSPPRMRGKAIRSFSDAGRFRITPAYAGKSIPQMHLKVKRWDHPRVCGEKFWQARRLCRM